MLHIF